MGKLYIFILLIATFLLFFGCGKDSISSEPGWIVGTDNLKIEDMDQDDVIVSVNGSSLTKERYEQMLQSNERGLRRRRPNAAKGLFESIMKSRRSALVREFINRQLYLSEVRERGLPVNAKVKSDLEALYRAQAKKEGKTFSEFAESRGDTNEELQQSIHERALIESLLLDEFGDTLKLTDEDVEKAKQRIVHYNEMCDATNKLVIARGERVVKELRAGADFKKMAEQYSEAEGEEDGYWDEFTRYEIDDANVRHAAFSLPVGAISDPFDTEEGLVIIKILERNGLDAVGATEEASVKLGRILLRMAQSRSPLPEEELRKELAREKKKQLLVSFITQIKTKSRIEFPHGTNLWTISKNRLMPRDRN
jgi:hypothetical protein